MAAELERARKRESGLAAVFTALDARDDADRRAGEALAALRELGESNGSIADLTGLSVREVSTLLRLADGGEEEDQGETDDVTDSNSRNDDAQDSDGATPAVSGF